MKVIISRVRKCTALPRAPRARPFQPSASARRSQECGSSPPNAGRLALYKVASRAKQQQQQPLDQADRSATKYDGSVSCGSPLCPCCMVNGAVASVPQCTASMATPPAGNSQGDGDDDASGVSACCGGKGWGGATVGLRWARRALGCQGGMHMKMRRQLGLLPASPGCWGSQAVRS